MRCSARGLVDREIDRKIFLQQLLVTAIALQFQKRAVERVDQIVVTLAHSNTHTRANDLCILYRWSGERKTLAGRLIQEAKTRGCRINEGRIQSPSTTSD